MATPSQSGRLNKNVRHRAQRAILVLVLQILYDAWPSTRESIATTDEEDSITNVLRWKMVEAKYRRNPVPQMEFLREPQSDTPGLDTPFGLIDIMVSYTFDEETYLTIECKRITSAENSLAREYVRNGICRFASGKYSPGHAFGIVAGYVICGDSPACADRISAQLTKEPESDTGYDVEFGWQTDDKLCQGQCVYKTRHRQSICKNVIELIHVPLVFESE